MTAYTALKFKIMQREREITYHMTNTTMNTFRTELTLFSTLKDMQYCQQLHVIDSHVHPAYRYHAHIRYVFTKYRKFENVEDYLFN